ncbi:MAG TPA: branched-chain amino acid ABC transporter permease/ATP-binding protein [Acidimicrobiia bacterium]|nr:branched-chain amino acid ABC transporter permease/ATP-binding protein [Acidimicrobiia bacterium]
MLGSLFTAQLLTNGVVDGLTIAVMAMGIVLVYRSSRVINFAAGELGVPSAALLAIMVANDHVPYWLALVGALAVGAAAGAVVELTIIRRLSAAPRVIVLVATIGVAELAQAVTTTLPGYRNNESHPQMPIPSASHWDIGSVRIDASRLFVLIVVPAVAVGLWALLGHTRFGESVRACATNRDLARLSGISPKLVASAIWTIAGVLSTLAVILWGTVQQSAEVIQIGPDTLLLGLVAALFGRMRSFPRAFAGAIAIGVLYRLLAFHYGNVSGLISFVLFLLALGLVAVMRRDDDAGGESFAFAPRVPPIPERLRAIWWVRWLPRLIGGIALAVALLIPLFITTSSHHLAYALILGFMICAVSVTVLTGWAGQLSLGQMAFAGIGALSAAAFVRGASLNIGWHSVRIIKGALPALPFGVSVLLGAILACAVAIVVGTGALRVRGLLLAISTFAFAIACDEYVFNRPFFSGSSFSTSVELPRGHLGPFDLTLRNRGYYYTMLAALVIVLLVAARLRRSGIGRVIIGVRENEAGAAALTVSPVRAKLIAFGTGGFIAGLGGALIGGLVSTISLLENSFNVDNSIKLVSMTVIGGLGTLAGPVVGALWVVGLPEFWPHNPTVPLLTSSIGLLIILLYLPGGFAQLGYSARSLLLRWAERRLGDEAVKARVEPPRSLQRARMNATPAVALETRDLSVQFGGLVAVHNVSMHANAGEIVGLIGTNGAGKSTLLNAIGGFVPSVGDVAVLGHDVTGLSSHARARVGMGRTFQAALLFPELTVRETVELALEARDITSFWGTVLGLPGARRMERTKRADAAELIDFLGLGRYADHFVAELSTGTRRIVELAAVLGAAPQVLLLDEPTAGVAQREAEAFAPLMRRVQQELDATLLIVEHDLPMLLGLSDRVYCLEAGEIIAEGPPEAIRNDARVIASYFGTDTRAIARSDAPT